MVTQGKGGVSLRPSEMVEGGAVPVDQNLTWERCRFELFSYTGKDGVAKGPPTVAFHASYRNDEGTEYEQYYSVGSPERFQPSKDGKILIPVTESQALSKSSNFAVLMSNLVSAGFPEDRIGEDISVLDGLYTFNIGIPEPKRVGLERAPAEGARPKILSVPSQIIKLPWEKKAAGKSRAAGAGDPAEEAAKLVVEIMGDTESISRAKAAARFPGKLAGNPNAEAISEALFGDEIEQALAKKGLILDGENIVSAE